MRPLLVCAALFTASPLAADPPDYIAFQELADRGAQMKVAAGVCPLIGYTVDQDGVEEALLQIIDYGVEDGIGVRAATRMLSAAIERAEEDAVYQLRRMKDGGEEAAEDYANAWFLKCDQMVLRPLSAPHFDRD